MRVVFAIVLVFAIVAATAEPQAGTANNIVDNIVRSAKDTANKIGNAVGYAKDLIVRAAKSCHNDNGDWGFCVPQCEDGKTLVQTDGSAIKCAWANRVCCDTVLPADTPEDYADPKEDENVGDEASAGAPTTSGGDDEASADSCDLSAYSAPYDCGNRYSHGTNLGPNKCIKLKPGQYTKKSDVSISQSLMCQMLNLASAARAAGVTAFNINSGFRTNAEQTALYNRNCCRGKCKCRPATAAPGGSNHQNGIALDIEVSSNPALYTFLSNHGQKLGWIRAVPSEKWHWEYRPGAKCNSIVKYPCKNG